jgi:hypothetical protein
MQPTELSNSCAQLEAALLEKAPIKSHLAYVTLNIEISGHVIEYRLSACLWKPGTKPEEAPFNAYMRGKDPYKLLDKLSRDIEVFELWTPAAIAATLGIEESV